MHIHFCGIGGAGIGPLAVIAHQAGYTVSGSDKQHSSYIDYVKKQGIKEIFIENEPVEVSKLHQKHPIDWLVYASALAKENPHHPMLEFARTHDIELSKRDHLLNKVISDKQLKLLAVAGTHGKTTTTAMVIWLLKQLGIPISYSVGAKSSFAEMGHYEEDSEYFVYECDEYDRNFLSFHPYINLISGIDWDHADIYPTRDIYNAAFRQYIDQSRQTYMWDDDAEKLALQPTERIEILRSDYDQLEQLHLAGEVNRRDACLALQIGLSLSDVSVARAIEILNQFPGVSRRFEKIAPHIYSDYAHTPEKIHGTLEVAREIAGQDVVVVYEGLHNTRQHFMKQDLKHLFDGIDSVYVVPSYLARENKRLKLLTPADIAGLLNEKNGQPAALNEQLKKDIKSAISRGKTVVALSAGGGGSLDEWLRREFTPSEKHGSR